MRRHARESHSYRKLPFVKSRSGTKFKATFHLSRRESYFAAMLSVGCFERFAKELRGEKIYISVSPFESELNKNII